MSSTFVSVAFLSVTPTLVSSRSRISLVFLLASFNFLISFFSFENFSFFLGVDVEALVSLSTLITLLARYHLLLIGEAGFLLSFLLFSTTPAITGSGSSLGDFLSFS